MDEMYNGKDLDTYALYCREIESIKELSQEEELELIKRIKNNDHDALNRFIEANLRLVRYIVSKFPCQASVKQDLIQEGNIALILAAKRFDLEKGYKFSTYAGNCIYSYLTIASHKVNSNFKSEYYVQKLNKYNKQVEELAKKLNHEPSSYEIAEELNIPLKMVDFYHNLSLIPISLNSTLDNDKDSEFQNTVADSNCDVENDVLLKVLNSDVKKLIKCSYLSLTEKKVIYYLFGFDGGGDRTQAEVGRILGITRAGVGKSLKSALKKFNNYKYLVSSNNTPIEKNIINEKESYKFNNETKKILKNVRESLNLQNYEELITMMIKINEDMRFSTITDIELIILLLYAGFVGNKSYVTNEISNITGLEYDFVRFMIHSILNKYQDVISELNIKIYKLK